MCGSGVADHSVLRLISAEARVALASRAVASGGTEPGRGGGGRRWQRADTGTYLLPCPLQFLHLPMTNHAHFFLFLSSQHDGDFGGWIRFLPLFHFCYSEWIGVGFGMLQIFVLHMCSFVENFGSSHLVYACACVCLCVSAAITDLAPIFFPKNQVPHHIRLACIFLFCF
jgi:hypothetical protein